MNYAKPLILILTMLFGCHSNVKTFDRVYTTVLPQEGITSSDPIKLISYSDEILFSQICGRLTSIDDGLNLASSLASKWEISNEGKRITFTIKNAHFYDGKQLSTEDIVFSLQRIFNNSDDMAVVWDEQIESIYTNSEHQITIDLKFPSTKILYKIANPRFCILNKDRPFIKINNTFFPNSPGHYKVISYNSEQLELEISADYKSEANEKRINIKFLSQSAAIEAFQKNEVDDISFFILASDELNAIQDQANIIKQPAYWTWLLSLNSTKGIFKSKSNRLNLVSQFDTKKFLNSWGTEVNGSQSIIPKGMNGYYEPAAEKLFVGADFNCLAPIQVVGILGLPEQEKLKRALYDEIKKITKCEVQIQFLDMSLFIASKAEMKADIFISGISSEEADPVSFYKFFVFGNKDQSHNYDDAHLNQEYLRLLAIPSEKRQKSDYISIQNIFYDTGFGLALGQPIISYVFSKDVKHISLSPLGMEFNMWYKMGRN